MKFIRQSKIGTNVIHNDRDVNMSGYTTKQLAKVQRMAEIFKRFETVPIPVRDFCMKEGIPTSTFS